jgi:hypothetical protein
LVVVVVNSKLVVSRIEPRYRRALNDSQLDILRLLYKFRFSSSELVTRYQGKGSIKLVQKKLKVLEDQGYIGKRYDKSYRLQGKAAAYYLTPKAARLLRQLKQQLKDSGSKDKPSMEIRDRGIKQLYKNKTVSEDFITHCLNILTVYLKLRDLYGDRCKFFTRVELAMFSYFPTWLPDAYFSLIPSPNSKVTPKRFFLDIWDGTRPFFISVRKARNYLTYSEEGDWLTDQADFPAVLMVCDTKKNETKLRRQIVKALDDSGEEVVFATTTLATFNAANTPKDKIWVLADDQDTIIALR